MRLLGRDAALGPQRVSAVHLRLRHIVGDGAVADRVVDLHRHEDLPAGRLVHAVGRRREVLGGGGALHFRLQRLGAADVEEERGGEGQDGGGADDDAGDGTAAQGAMGWCGGGCGGGGCGGGCGGACACYGCGARCRGRGRRGAG